MRDDPTTTPAIPHEKDIPDEEFDPVWRSAGDASALPGGPPIACTEALYGEFYTVERYRPVTGWVYTTYVCDAPGAWQLYMVCDSFECELY